MIHNINYPVTLSKQILTNSINSTHLNSFIDCIKNVPHIQKFLLEI